MLRIAPLKDKGLQDFVKYLPPRPGKPSAHVHQVTNPNKVCHVVRDATILHYLAGGGGGGGGYKESIDCGEILLKSVISTGERTIVPVT